MMNAHNKNTQRARVTTQPHWQPARSRSRKEPPQCWRDGSVFDSGSYLVTSGAIATVAAHTSGRSAAVEIIGAPCILLPAPKGMSYLALGDVEALLLEQSLLLHPKLLCDYWLERTRLQQSWLNALVFERASVRIAYLFCSLLDAGRREIPVRLSYDRIAGLCGVTERSVERTVSGWVRSGAVRRCACRYTMVDADKIRNELGEAIVERGRAAAILEPILTQKVVRRFTTPSSSPYFGAATLSSKTSFFSESKVSKNC